MMNSTKKLVCKSLLAITLALNACSQTMTVVPVNATPTKLSTLLPTATSYPQLTPTSDVLEKAHITEECPNILPSADLPEIKAGGVVVLLKGQYLDDIRNAYLLNLANNQLFEFSQQGENLSYYSIAVSPDRKTLVYGVGTPKDETIKLVLSNSMGERQKIIPIQSDLPYPMYGNVGGWLTNQQLFLDRELLNPYTGEKRSFNPEDFPDILPNDFGVYSLDFDPELTRVIYPHSHATTAMADLETKQVLAELPAQYRGAPKVAWLPNGNLVAIVGAGQAQEGVADEIFLVDRDGKDVRQVTHLSTYYGTGYVLFNLSWSPDGNRIAFWQNDRDPSTKGLRLFILDTKTEELTSYCTWGEPTNVTFYGPIWSPDGTQILIGDLTIKDAVRAVIIDIDKNVAVPVGEDVIPVGWMVTP